MCSRTDCPGSFNAPSFAIANWSDRLENSTEREDHTIPGMGELKDSQNLAPQGCGGVSLAGTQCLPFRGEGGDLAVEGFGRQLSVRT